MFRSFTKDILLKVNNKAEVLDFFNSLGFNTSFYETYGELKTDHYNLYFEESPTFEMVMEIIVDDLEKVKDFCLEKGCMILTWNEIEHHLKHPSGFSFNLLER